LLATCGTAAAQAPAGASPYHVIPSGASAEQPPAGSPTPTTNGASACPSVNADRCEGIGPAAPTDDRVWFGAEFLLWWIKNDHVPPLVTTSPPSSTGTLGQPGTVVLFGPDSDLTRSPIPGGRFTAGGWLDDCRNIGLEGSYFFLAPRGNGFEASGDGSPNSPVLARPFFNTSTGREDSELVAFPKVLAGSVRVDPSSRLQGFEVNALYNLCCCCNYRIDALAGFRYLDLDEGLGITEDLTVLPGVPVLGGTRFVVQDSFGAHNQFYGGQLGLRATASQGRFFAVANLKVALGECEEGVDISGFTQITRPTGAVSTQPGGLLALPSNSGHFFSERFAVVPEGSFTLGYQVTDNLSISIGYTFLYWSRVARPGDQIDRAINPAALPISGAPAVPSSRPAFSFNETDFWAQGLTFGLELRF
jgi:hypothetical protein